MVAAQPRLSQLGHGAHCLRQEPHCSRRNEFPEHQNNYRRNFSRNDRRRCLRCSCGWHPHHAVMARLVPNPRTRSQGRVSLMMYRYLIWRPVLCHYERICRHSHSAWMSLDDSKPSSEHLVENDDACALPNNCMRPALPVMHSAQSLLGAQIVLATLTIVERYKKGARFI